MYCRKIPPCVRLKHRLWPATVRLRSTSRSPTNNDFAPRPSSSTNYFNASHVVQSSSASTTAIVLVAASLLGGLAVLFQAFDTTENNDHKDALNDQRAGDYARMADIALPERPGKLTTKQETKLQELWTATFHIFGVPGLENGANIESPESGKGEAGKGPEKKKKKRLGLFGSKKPDEVDGEDVNGLPAMEGEDKHGQAKEFRKILESESPEDLRQAFWSMVKHDNPDGLLLRFLRARKWHVHNALIMLIATVHWRFAEMKVDDDIVRRGEGGAADDSASPNAALKKEGDDFLAQFRLGKSFIHGTDKEGRPICCVRVRLHKQGEQSEKSLERFTVYTIETCRILLTSNVDTAAILFDMTDFSMANMDYGPVKFMIKVFEANYPESLGVVLVHKSPWIFHSIWKIIKGWLDPVVASKVHFTKNSEELSDFIESSHLTRELGGDNPWAFQYVEPVPGENDLLKDESTRNRLLEERAAVVKEFEKTTQQWIQNSASQEVGRERGELIERLRTGYWELDPYLRARTLYDRIGMIQEGGRIRFHEDAETAPAVNAAKAVQNGPLPAQHFADDVD